MRNPDVTLEDVKKADKRRFGREDSLYEMKEHEVLHLNTNEPWEVLRVPGGWIYTRFCESGAGGYEMSSCFVPIVAPGCCHGRG